MSDEAFDIDIMMNDCCTISSNSNNRVYRKDLVEVTNNLERLDLKNASIPSNQQERLRYVCKDVAILLRKKFRFRLVGLLDGDGDGSTQTYSEKCLHLKCNEDERHEKFVFLSPSVFAKAQAALHLSGECNHTGRELIISDNQCIDIGFPAGNLTLSVVSRDSGCFDPLLDSMLGICRKYDVKVDMTNWFPDGVKWHKKQANQKIKAESTSRNRSHEERMRRLRCENFCRLSRLFQNSGFVSE